MSEIDIAPFRGMAQHIDPRNLENNAAHLALNVRLDEGDIRQFRDYGAPVTLPISNPKMIYKHPGGWLAWPNYGAVAPTHWGTLADPVVYAGVNDGSRMAWFNNARAGTMTGKPVGGKGPLTQPHTHVSPSSPVPSNPQPELRYMVYTLVRAAGEPDEGQETLPSPISGGSYFDRRQTIRVTNIQHPAGESSGYDKLRLYMNRGIGVQADWVMVGEHPMVSSPADAIDVPATIPDYAVGDTPIQVARLGAELVTEQFDPPPDTAHSPIALPSGVIAMIDEGDGGAIVYSDPDHSYAFPPDNRIPIPVRPVAIRRIDQSHVVLTEGAPYLVTGTVPGEFRERKLNSEKACSSPASAIEAGQFGVCYSSPNGFVSISANGEQLLTENLFTYEQWGKLNPASHHAVYWDNLILIFYDATADTENTGNVVGLDTTFVVNRGSEETTDDTQDTNLLMPRRGAIVLAPDGSMTALDTPADAAWVDPAEDRLYLALNDQVREFDADVARRHSCVWRSKIYRFPSPVNFGWAQVVGADLSMNLTVLARTAPSIGSKSLEQAVVTQRPVLDADRWMRLPSGLKSTEWQFQLTGYGTVHRFRAARNSAGIRA